jgi:ABC-type transport system involved in multi-copper enzyme maturation permease subunit
MSAQAVTQVATFQPRTRPSFAGAVRSELLKTRRQVMTWVLLSLVAVVTAVALGELVASGRPTLQAHPEVFYFTYLSVAQALFDVLSGIFLLAVTSRLVGMEYSGGTIRIVLARGTARLHLLAAQLVAVALWGVVLLAGFTLVAGVVLGAVVQAWHGSLSPLASLPGAAWTDAWISLLVSLVSMGVCILLATATAAVGRSLPFAMGVALAFFPADNFGAIVMGLVGRATHNYQFWNSITQWFLGPSLNQLAATLQTDHSGSTFLPTPLVAVSAGHLWMVIGGWSLLFAVAAVVLTWRRDVLE